MQPPEQLAPTIPGSAIPTKIHNTRSKALLKPENDIIRYEKLRKLGKGGQGEVYKVVDKYTGAHYACKIIAVQSSVPGRRIYSEEEFRAQIKKEVNLVRQVKNVSSLRNDRST